MGAHQKLSVVASGFQTHSRALLVRDGLDRERATESFHGVLGLGFLPRVWMGEGHTGGLVWWRPFRIVRVVDRWSRESPLPVHWE